MKLEDIQNLWEKDCDIDRTELGEESLKISQLHSKYFKLFSSERLLFKKLDKDYKDMYRTKFEYYNGVLSHDELKENVDKTEYSPDSCKISLTLPPPEGSLSPGSGLPPSLQSQSSQSG